MLDEGDVSGRSPASATELTTSRDYARISGPDEFRELEPAGRTVGGCLPALDRGRARTGRSDTWLSEARVDPVDPTTRMRLRALWTVIGPFEKLVGAEPLTVAARRAEAAAG